MWFLWFIITFFTVTTSGVQITDVMIDKNKPNRKEIVIVSVIMVIIWLIISVAVESIRNHWMALLVGWLLGLIVTRKSFKSNKAKPFKKNWNDLSFEEKIKEVEFSFNIAKKQMEEEGIDVDGELQKYCDEINRQHNLGKYKKDKTSGEDLGDTQECVINEQEVASSKLCEKLNAIFLRLVLDGGIRMVSDITEDEAGIFLCEVCATMPYSPTPRTLYGLYAVCVKDLGDEPTIIYGFEYPAGVIAQPVIIFLVRTNNSKLRLFAVETSFPFALCEYLDGSHINYGQLDDLDDAPNRIKEILINDNE